MSTYTCSCFHIIINLSHVFAGNMQVQVRRYASQLTDLVEHDANELLAILLDSLHEDLNLVKTKLSIDMTVPTKGREEQVSVICSQ